MAPGETLYSIAWRYDVDHRQLARANGIGGDYLIYPGQRLTLDLSAQPRAEAAARRQGRSPAPTKRAPIAATSPKPRSENQTPVARKSPPTVSASDPAAWRWPVTGPVLEAFASNGGLNKGIDLGGKLGEPVLAAAAGQVVYSGSGLRGYGKLIIVKHSEKYLSAYAHNSKLLGEEGDTVEAGQQIAEVGSSGADRAKLHFEIRYDGKPVNPLKYLPPR